MEQNELRRPALPELLYEEAIKKWNEIREQGPKRLEAMSCRRGMNGIANWVEYNARFKPITYQEYLDLLARAARGEIPPLPWDDEAEKRYKLVKCKTAPAYVPICSRTTA